MQTYILLTVLYGGETCSDAVFQKKTYLGCLVRGCWGKCLELRGRKSVNMISLSNEGVWDEWNI